MPPLDPLASPRKYAILLAAILMQLCLGATYAWSVFVAPIRAWWEIGQGEAQVPFTVFYIVFPAMAVPAGRLISRWPVRRCAMLGGLLFGGGWLLGSLGEHHFAFTIAGIGFLAGTGAGLAYLVPIQTCILWFPRQKALVSGLAVAGFGGGAALVAMIGNRLMQHSGMSPFEVFRVFGVAYALLIPLAGWVMVRPPASQAVAAAKFSMGAILRQRLFWVLYAAMTGGLMAGFTINANLKELVGSNYLQLGVTAVALFAIGNAAGRVGWGWIFDRLPGAAPVAANLVLQAGVVIAIGLLLPARPQLLLWLALAAGINYGGVLVLYASAVATAWGIENVGRIYGCLFSSNIVAAVAPFLAGLAYDRTGSFMTPFLVIAGVLAVAAAGLSRGARGMNAPAREPSVAEPTAGVR